MQTHTETDRPTCSSQYSTPYKGKRVQFSNTRYRALGLELIPVYWQSAHRWLVSNHPPGGRLSLLSTRPAVTSVAFTRWCQPCMVAHIRFQLTAHIIDPKRLSWPGWLTCSKWFIHNSSHPSAASWARDRESSLARDRRSTTVQCNHPYYLWGQCKNMQNWPTTSSSKAP